MNNIDKLLIILGIIISFIVGIFIGKEEFNSNDKEKENNKNINIDTSYNKVILDSIDYNITKKDSIITEIKKKFEYEKFKAINASDTDAVKQFIKLASE